MRTHERSAQEFGTAAASRAAAERRCCEREGCDRDGVHRAPRSRQNLQEYVWFCLDHVREYNAAWNYYAGMSDAQIEDDVRRDTVWQRPSWPLAAGLHACAWSAARIDDGFAGFDGEHPAPRRQPKSPHETALAVLDLRPPVTAAVVKSRYKALVKRHHPDANGGDKAAEERFKRISEAYRAVMDSLAQ
ncbi:MAG: J domain-containing protein [Rhodospirillales bacterium]|nr:J domain-containing protein [Rhodospirillales bacterium]